MWPSAWEGEPCKGTGPLDILWGVLREESSLIVSGTHQSKQEVNSLDMASKKEWLAFVFFLVLVESNTFRCQEKFVRLPISLKFTKEEMAFHPFCCSIVCR